MVVTETKHLKTLKFWYSITEMEMFGHSDAKNRNCDPGPIAIWFSQIICIHRDIIKIDSSNLMNLIVKPYFEQNVKESLKHVHQFY